MHAHITQFTRHQDATWEVAWIYIGTRIHDRDMIFDITIADSMDDDDDDDEPYLMCMCPQPPTTKRTVVTPICRVVVMTLRTLYGI